MLKRLFDILSYRCSVSAPLWILFALAIKLEDRGHVGELRATVDALKNGRPSPIDFKSIVATTVTTFAIEESITKGKAVEINLSEWGIS